MRIIHGQGLDAGMVEVWIPGTPEQQQRRYIQSLSILATGWTMQSQVSNIQFVHSLIEWAPKGQWIMLERVS